MHILPLSIQRPFNRLRKVAMEILYQRDLIEEYCKIYGAGGINQR